MNDNKRKVIEFLDDPKDFKVLKIIEMRAPKNSFFSGYLPYLRNYVPNSYTRETTDLIDEKILDVIKQSLPESFLRYSIDILFKGDLEENLRSIEGGSRKNITIQFNPLLPYSNLDQFVGKQFSAYPINFNARMLFSTDLDNRHYINDYLLCHIPYETLDEAIKTITTI